MAKKRGMVIEVHAEYLSEQVEGAQAEMVWRSWLAYLSGEDTASKGIVFLSTYSGETPMPMAISFRNIRQILIVERTEEEIADRECDPMDCIR